MGFFDDLYNSASDAVASVGEAVSSGANSVGDALDYVDNVGHSYLGEAYDYIPIISDITSIGADAAHEVGDAGTLVSDVARGRETLSGGLARGGAIAERMGKTGVDAGIAYTAGKIGGSAGKSWAKAGAKGAEKVLGKTGAKIAQGIGKEVVGGIVGHQAGARLGKMRR